MQITVNGLTLTATLADNQAVKQLVNQLPVTIKMRQYGGWEMVGELPYSLPRDDRHIKAVPGDLMLYEGSNIVIFYGENSWTYTPIGKIDSVSVDELRDIFKSPAVEVKLSLDYSELL